MFHTQLKWAGFVSISCALVLSQPGFVAYQLCAQPPGQQTKSDQDDVKKEQARLEGTWKLVSLEVEGNAKDLKGMGITYEFAGNMVTLKNGPDGNREMTCEIDPSKTPKTMDTVYTGVRLTGIYELKGDTLKIAYNEKSEKRPTEFVTKQGTPTVLLVLERGKKP